MSGPAERLYALLPAVLRLRDAAAGEPLRALMAVLEAELSRIETDIETTYDNWFVETCEEWLVPYLGQALGVQGVRSVGAVAGAGSSGADFTLRAYVANTLSRRRRKGTAAATEALARDVTGYPCRAVEMFATTAVTANLNHLRGADALPAPAGTADLRDPARCERTGGAFDAFARTVDVRPVGDGVPRPNLPNLSLFLWRAQAQEISGSQARPVAGHPGWFTVEPLGGATPLFNLPQPEEEIADLAGPEHVPHPMTRLELDRLPAGADPPVVVRVDVPGDDPRTLAVQSCTLTALPGGGLPARQPVTGTAAVDPELGRLRLDDGDLPPGAEVLVDHVFGAPGRVGAGPQDRTASWLAQLGEDEVSRQLGVGRELTAVAGEPVFATLEAAVTDWNAWIAALPVADRAMAVGVVVLTDSRRHAAPTTIAQVPDGARLHVVAAGWPVRDDAGVPVRRAGDVTPAGLRPHVDGDLIVAGSVDPAAPELARPGGLFLNGLLVEGAVHVVGGDLERLELASCTVTGGVVVQANVDGRNERLAVAATRSVLGPVAADGAIGSLTAADGALLASETDPARAGEPGAWAVSLPGATVDLTACTVIGGVRARTLSASDSVLDEGILPPARALDVAVRQEGCLRFSYVPAGAGGPRRHRCQPDTALDGVTDPAARRRIVARLRPAYDGVRVGDPGFLLLSGRCPAELRTAASDGSEPGVWHHLGHALRMANLTAALRQYLRFGLEAGAIFDR